MAVSYNTLTDANGNYSFANLVEGNYILVAEPDTTLFPNTLITYSNGSALWFDSDTIQVSCTSQQVVDITLLDAIQQVGTAQIGGFVAEYTFNMLNNILSVDLLFPCPVTCPSHTIIKALLSFLHIFC